MDENEQDVRLMMQVRDGTTQESSAAFRQLYERYTRRLGKFFYLATRDYALAADLIQDTFLKLWGARARYEATGKFSTYLFQIAKNHWINVREKKLRRPAQVSLDESPEGDSPSPQITSDQPGPERVLTGREDEARLLAAVSSLPDKHRAVFILSQIEGLKHRDIATILDIPEGTVKSRMFNAITKLRELLDEARPAERRS